MSSNRAIPVTDHIRNILLERIITGNYNKAGKLPSESALCREFAASRASVRMAIAALAERGYVIRRPGLGTFLSPSPRLEGGLERLESILSMAHKHNLPTRLADLDVSLVPADDFLCDRLSLNPGDEVTCVSRTILIGETPVSYQTDHVPTHYLRPERVDHDFNGSVLDLLRQGCHLDIPDGITEITAVEADEDMRRHFRVRKSIALILMKEKLFNYSGLPVDYSENYFLPERFYFRVLRRE
jgi:GntR family transcriptional regulator